MSQLDALRAIDFDWTMHTKSVWCDPPYDAPSLQAEIRAELVRKLDALDRDRSPLSPLGWPIVGSGGSGKTHLLSVVRREAMGRGQAFVLVDLTDVHDFWATVLLGYLNSLQQACNGEQFQYRTILKRFIESLHPAEPAGEILGRLQRAKTSSLADETRRVLQALGRRHPQETMKHQDVIRALIALNSDDFDVSSTGLTWLQGHSIEEEARSALGFRMGGRAPKEIVEAISWLMSLAGPAVLALDQLDPIVTYLNIAAGGSARVDGRNEEVRVAKAIIEKIAAGLGALRDTTQRTLIVPMCVEATWNRLREQVALKTNLDRYETPRTLPLINSGATAEAVLRSRLDPAYRGVSFSPPYPTWPFAPEMFRGAQGITPRQILKFACEHRESCLRRGTVSEVHRFAPEEALPAVAAPAGRLSHLDQRFDEHRRQADPAGILEEKMDDDCLAPLLQTACRCLVIENPLPPNLGAVIDVDFHGGKTTRPLHVRVRLVHLDEGEREEHFCVRALQREHARAFQARLNAAMIQAGIDRRLGFRHLAIVRATDPPGGKVTGEMVERFFQAGGAFLKPVEDELRTLWALWRLDQERHADFAEWLRQRRPASQLALMRTAVGPLCGDRQEAAPAPREEASGVSAAGEPTSADEEAAESRPRLPNASAELTLGWRTIGDRLAEPVRMPIAALEKHTVILAGAGSGKTVLIRRMVEEAALAGIPSIVIDCANDLATLGDPWPSPPEAWLADDRAKAEAYRGAAEVVVWTPGRESGNPLRLEPLPDLAAAADDEDELNVAVEMVRESLQGIAAPGAPAGVGVKLGVLSSALRYFARHGGGRFSDFVRFLKELPAGAGPGVRNEEKLARDMADRMKAEMERNVLLRDTGAALDPATLFGDAPPSRATRVSVINFVGLPGLESQRQFLSQLAMTLFSWIKKNPNPPGRLLRGLLVIDEAKDFIPSQGTTACKPSLLRLAAQARKYHLGVVFATQNPKEIANTVIGNCSTHYYGKAGSPEAIRVLREQVQLRGGNGDDIPTLPKGTFYVYNADAGLPAPVKIRVPMCLSHHRPNPLEEQEILQRAARSRRLLE